MLCLQTSFKVIYMKKTIINILFFTLFLGDVMGNDFKYTEPEFVSWAAKGNVEKITLALKHGGKEAANAKNQIGMSALHVACRSNHLEVVKLLVENGADKTKKYSLNEIDLGKGPVRGVTALDIAKSLGHTDIVNFLQLKKSK